MKNVLAVCENLEEFKEATNLLDKASIGELRINDNGIWKDVKRLRGIYNNTQGVFTCAVVPHYNLVQHKEYFDHFAQSLHNLGINYTATLKYSGHKAYVDFEFKDRNLKFTKLNEEFTTGMRIANSYDKSCGLIIAPRFTRLACTNGMIITKTEKSVSIKHHSKIAKEIQTCVEHRLNDLISTNLDLQTWVSESMKDSGEWKTMCRIIEKMILPLKHREPILKNLGISIIIVTDKKTKKKQVSYVLDDINKNKEPINRWTLYNSLTRYISHGEAMTPFIETLFHKWAEKALMTPLNKMPMVEKVLTV